MTQPSTTRFPRGRRGTFATVTALVGVAVCAAAATEAISLAAHGRTVGPRTSDVTKFGRDTHLGDSVVLVVAIIVFVLGAIVLLAALVPARRRVVELTDTDPQVASGLTSRSLHRTLAAAAQDVDGVSDAKVSGGRRLKVTAHTALRDTAALPDRITARVTSRLDGLNPAKKRTVRVTLNRKDD